MNELKLDRSLHQRAVEKANRIASELMKKYGATQVFLYGSLVNGWFIQGSDIDLIADQVSDFWTVYGLVEKIASPFDYNFSVYDDKNDSFYKRVTSEGVILPTDPDIVWDRMPPPTVERRLKAVLERLELTLQSIAHLEELLERWGGIGTTNTMPSLNDDLTVSACKGVIDTVIRLAEGFIIVTLRKLDGIPGLYRDMPDDRFDQVLIQAYQPANGLRPAILSNETMQLFIRYRKKSHVIITRDRLGDLDTILKEYPEFSIRLKNDLVVFRQEALGLLETIRVKTK
jgi:predicted nucleotidyltransferase